MYRRNRFNPHVRFGARIPGTPFNVSIGDKIGPWVAVALCLIAMFKFFF